MSNVEAMLRADCKEFNFSNQYEDFIVSKYKDGLVDYDPETKEILLTDKAIEEGFTLRSANSLN